ncbi:hypothetical protein CK203_098174 [Vitis vinifera]|uniref:Uncharacterized protein n=1 Tax=Vitis vinifera TaxID=29760 RepID=A0A438C0R7_VITVI|nr:hypothetical protein CK203_098174 [Vitis vinifera]
MILRSLQPRIARHVVGVPFTNFGSLVSTLYDVKDGILRGLWSDSSLVDAKRKKPVGGQRSVDVGVVSSTSQRPPKRHQRVLQPTGTYPSYPPQQHRSWALPQLYDQVYLPPTLILSYYTAQGAERPLTSYPTPIQPCYTAQVAVRPLASYPRPRAPQRSAHFALKTPKQFSQLGMSLSQALRKLTDARLLMLLAPRPLSQPIPPQFRMDLYYAYHQGLGHETDRCTALRHVIQDLMDQGLVHLGQSSVTTNPLLAHTSHAVLPPTGDIHFMDFTKPDDRIHMLSWDDSEPEPIVVNESYEVDGVISDTQASAPFRLVPNTPLVQLTTYVICGGRVVRQQPPIVARPLESDVTREEIRREDDEILRQLQSTQTHISIWSLLASSTSHWGDTSQGVESDTRTLDLQIR